MASNYELIPAVKTVLELSPANRRMTFFDKAMDVAHLLLDGPLAVGGGIVNSAIQTYALMKEHEQDIKAVKYLTHLEEMRLLADVETRRVQAQHDAMILYVDRRFQDTIDGISQEYLQHSRALEADIRKMMRDIDGYTQSKTAGINAYYQAVIRENELVCAAYRDFLHTVSSRGISANDVSRDITYRLLDISDKLSDSKFENICEVIIKMMEPRDIISFEDFVRLRKNAR